MFTSNAHAKYVANAVADAAFRGTEFEHYSPVEDDAWLWTVHNCILGTPMNRACWRDDVDVYGAADAVNAAIDATLAVLS